MLYNVYRWDGVGWEPIEQVDAVSHIGAVNAATVELVDSVPGDTLMAVPADHVEYLRVEEVKPAPIVFWRRITLGRKRAPW